MRKTIVSELARLADERAWIDLEHSAQVQFTSEHPDHPIETDVLSMALRLLPLRAATRLPIPSIIRRPELGRHFIRAYAGANSAIHKRRRNG